ncbi:MAG: phosphopantetheine-binding protein [Verrucomicrobiota bacterium]|nr:phosphopantetheine-binding protein [Verrucomicrobiota bacterium]
MDKRLEDELDRAPKGTREALYAFKESGELEQLEIFAKGVIARNIDDAYIETLNNADDSTRMIDDLGIDSLTMLEIAMTFEDALGIELIDDELSGIETYGSMRDYLIGQIKTKSP